MNDLIERLNRAGRLEAETGINHDIVTEDGETVLSANDMCLAAARLEAVAGKRRSPPTSEARLTDEDARNFPEEVLFALRNPPKGDRITIWKDGTWKRWEALDAINARVEADWLSEIPTKELSRPLPGTNETDDVRPS